METITEHKHINEESLSLIVHAFYAKVRHDEVIGPIFNEAVENWDAHLSLLVDFWSTVLLGTGRYKGNPMLAHFPINITALHLERWLLLFEKTANEILVHEDAVHLVAKARRIGENILRMRTQYGMA